MVPAAGERVVSATSLISIGEVQGWLGVSEYGSSIIAQAHQLEESAHLKPKTRVQ